MRLWTGLGFLMVMVAGTAAQEPVALRLTLGEAQAQAIEVSHRLAAARALGEAAEADVMAVDLTDRPSLALEAGFIRTNHVTEFVVPSPTGELRVLYPDVPNNYRSRVGLQWPVYTGGRIDAQVRAAQAEAGASAADLAVARADLRLEVARAFWALVSADAVVVVFARGMDRANAHLAVARERFTNGLTPPNEVASAEAQVSQQQMLLIEAGNARDLAASRLARLVGVDLTARLELVATLEGASQPPRPFEALVADALVARNDRRALERRAEAASQQGIAVSLSMRPTVAVAAGVDLARPNPRIFPRADRWNESWDASLNVTWPLWDGGRRAADVERATQRAVAAREQLAELDSVIALEIRGHQLAIASGRAAAAAATDAITAATEARRVVTERYAAGVAIQADVLDAEIAMLQAELNRTRALVGVRLAEAELERAGGR